MNRPPTVLKLPSIADGKDKSPLGDLLCKNYRHMQEWSQNTLTNCFRLYDGELDRYPLAIDFYAGRFSVHYFAKKSASEEPPGELIQEVNGLLCTIFSVTPQFIFWRTRAKHKESRQYEKRGGAKSFFTVLEYGVKFKVNLTDYLDTGLFLDHRETRRLVASYAHGKRFLNLFAYTCSFSVHAALAKASFTKSVDLSNTYTRWGEDNFVLNGLSPRNNEIVRDDCMKFLPQELRRGIKYDLIVIDPPTISRSKKMDKMFDIQVDYIPLISQSLKLLAKGGIIFFSNNARTFVFDETKFSGTAIEEITDKTLPIDFPLSKIHRCWSIRL